jgi:hypothetical protein
MTEEIRPEDQEDTRDNADPLNDKCVVCEMEIALSALSLTRDTQMRVDLNEETLRDYGQDMLDGDPFPPVDAITDGETTWIVDGHHRVIAAGRAGLQTIPVRLRRGTQRDAILAAACANSEHGLRRTNADKRRAVQALLTDPEWMRWSDRKISRACCVNQSTVSRIRKDAALSDAKHQMTRRVVRDGTEFEMRVPLPVPRGGDADPLQAEVVDAVDHTVEAQTSAWSNVATYVPEMPNLTASRGDTTVIAHLSIDAEMFVEAAHATLTQAGIDGVRRAMELGLDPEAIATLGCGLTDGETATFVGIVHDIPSGIVVPGRSPTGQLRTLSVVVRKDELHRVAGDEYASISLAPTMHQEKAPLMICSSLSEGLWWWKRCRGGAWIAVVHWAQIVELRTKLGFAQEQYHG